MANILSRIEEIATREGISIGAFERSIGASKGVLSRAINNGTDIQSKWIQTIVENYPCYSAEWLIAGRGDMISHKQEKRGLFENKVSNDLHDAIIATAGTQGKPIPLVYQSAAAGFGNANFAIAEADVKEYYVVPKFKYCNVDFMIEISGSSMYPKYNSGDVVACTIIRESNFIQWNKCHIIATREQGILCKRLKPSDTPDCILAVSDNKEYPSFDVPKSEITGIALVVGVIRLE